MVSKAGRDGMRKGIFGILFALALVLIIAVPGFSAIQAPENVQAELIHNEVHLSWNASANATGYHVYRSTDNTTYTLLGNSTTTSYVDKDLNISYRGVYYYKITAYNETTESEGTIVTVKFYPPAAPDGLTVQVQFGKVTLNWNNVTGAKGYYVYRGTESGKETLYATVSNNSYVDTNVDGGETYYYYVTAYNNTGESAASVELKVVVSAGAGTVTVGGVNWNTYLLGIGALLLLISVPVFLYGKRSHRDVAAFAVFGAVILLVSSYVLALTGTKPAMLNIAGYALNTVLAIVGVVFFVAGVLILLGAKAVRGKSEYADVGVFAIAIGVIASVLSYVVTYLTL